jgi:hypothetical protein
MVPEDLLFWIAAINESPTTDPSLLCLRHADTMVVPRGWTLDDRRENSPRLFNPRTLPRQQTPTPKPKRRRPHASDEPTHQQMQIDGTGEFPRPDVPAAVADPEPWQPDFDEEDDLGGLLQVESPLLARAFRGTDRPKR